MTKLLVSIAAVATVLTSPAFATDPTGPRATIQLADLDLSRPGDARKLERRVARATEAVCGSYLQARDGVEDRIARCRADVARQLEPQLAALRAKGQVAQR